jgi:hypothetical protein
MAVSEKNFKMFRQFGNGFIVCINAGWRCIKKRGEIMFWKLNGLHLEEVHRITDSHDL